MWKNADLRPRQRRGATAAELAAKEATRSANKQKGLQAAKAAFVEGLSKQRQAAASAVAPPDAGVSHTQAVGADGAPDGADPPAPTSDGNAAGLRADTESTATRPAASGQPHEAEADVGQPLQHDGEPLQRDRDNIECVDVEDDGDAEEGAIDKLDAGTSVMKRYARKIAERLRLELSRKTATDNWLLAKLEENNDWLLAKSAREVMAKVPADSDPADWLATSAFGFRTCAGVRCQHVQRAGQTATFIRTTFASTNRRAGKPGSPPTTAHPCPPQPTTTITTTTTTTTTIITAVTFPKDNGSRGRLPRDDATVQVRGLREEVPEGKAGGGGYCRWRGPHSEGREALRH